LNTASIDFSLVDAEAQVKALNSKQQQRFVNASIWSIKP
jgi:hypothetical protein